MTHSLFSESRSLFQLSSKGLIRMLKMLYLLSQQCYITNTISPPGQGFSAANTHLFTSNVLPKKLKNRLRKYLYLKPRKLSNYINPLSCNGSIILVLNSKFILCLTAAIGLCCWFPSWWNSDYWVMLADYPISIPLCWVPFIIRVCSIQGEFTIDEQGSLKNILD